MESRKDSGRVLRSDILDNSSLIRRRVIFLSVKWNFLPLSAQYILPTAQLFLDCFDSPRLIQWVHEPTCPRSCNILDLFFTSDPDCVRQMSVLSHCLNVTIPQKVVDYLFQFNHTVATQTKPFLLNERTPYHWERGRYNIMNRELILIDWGFEFAHKDSNACYQRFFFYKKSFFIISINHTLSVTPNTLYYKSTAGGRTNRRAENTRRSVSRMMHNHVIHNST